MWNSGITFRQRSAPDSARCAAMLPADATRLAWLSGTSFGPAVVPEVCSSSATSSGVQGVAPVSGAGNAPMMLNCPAGAASSSSTSMTTSPSSSATARSGPASPRSSTIICARRSCR